jgi:hypothetical protein
MVDMYPSRDNLLANIVDKVSILAQSKIRLIRFAFTYIALSLTKVLLSQYNDLSVVLNRLKAQSNLTQNKDNILKSCHTMIQNLLEILSVEVI